MAGEWSDRNEIVQRVIRQILQKRGAVRLSTDVNEKRVTISWQLPNQSGRGDTPRARMVLYCHRLADGSKLFTLDGGLFGGAALSYVAQNGGERDENAWRFEMRGEAHGKIEFSAVFMKPSDLTRYVSTCMKHPRGRGNFVVELGRKEKFGEGTTQHFRARIPKGLLCAAVPRLDAAIRSKSDDGVEGAPYHISQLLSALAGLQQISLVEAALNRLKQGYTDAEGCAVWRTANVGGKKNQDPVIRSALQIERDYRRLFPANGDR